MDNDRTPPEPHQFSDLNEVPQPWKSHRGGALQLQQINALIKRGHDLGEWKQHDSGESYYVPDESLARDEFRARHIIKNGFWVPKDKA